MNLQVGVKILLKNQESKYLLLQRSLIKYPEISKSNLWDIAGGRINPGTPLLENLKREVKEETGLELTKEPKLFYAQDILRPDKHIVRLTYAGEIEGEPKVDPEEHDGFKWSTYEELIAMPDLDSYLREALKHFPID